MERLVAVFKLGMITLAGIMGASVIITLLFFWVMRDSQTYHILKWLALGSLTATVVLGLGGVVILFHAGWREAVVDSALRPLIDQTQTRFLVDIPFVRRFGVLDIRGNSIRGAVIGQSEGKASPITPVSYDLESAANLHIPFPESYPAGSNMNELFNDLFGGL